MYVYILYSSEFLVIVVYMDIYMNDFIVSKIYWILIV